MYVFTLHLKALDCAKLMFYSAWYGLCKGFKGLQYFTVTALAVVSKVVLSVASDSRQS
jgi:hypothetical protein